jgi:hypothetical protein
MIEPGKVKSAFRGELYVDGALAGWCFPLIDGAVNISVYPSVQDCTPALLAVQSFFARYTAKTIAKQSNKENRQVHIHPFLAPDFRLWLRDVAILPITIEEHKVRSLSSVLLLCCCCWCCCYSEKNRSCFCSFYTVFKNNF